MKSPCFFGRGGLGSKAQHCRPPAPLPSGGGRPDPSGSFLPPFPPTPIHPLSPANVPLCFGMGIVWFSSNLPKYHKGDREGRLSVHSYL